ncbi:SDR family oxidoreductase [Leucobacter allii]|uniref:SDR family NAD(P)-dependent oxidoreductase n=1 Tax=Leucobacter allii TaxID=2932247 RepID=UPI001FD1B9B9|nr:SDR family oxidoreductase [Leucobacter allii]UOR01809.1 SDR family oxidoreductase [Leucobacter allii]
MTDENWAQATADPLATAAGPWLPDAVAVVAGGGLSGPAGGVGFAIAWLCARNGARVAVLDRDAACAERAVAAIRAAGGDAEAFTVDVTDDDSVRRTIAAVHERFGRIDVLADSIGGGSVRSLLDVGPEEFHAALDLNFMSAWSLIRHAQPHLRRGGAIVTISSGAAEGRGPGTPYGVAKTALEKLTLGAAGSLAERGIRANCVRVGMIWGAFAARGMSEEQREVRRRNVALQTEGNVWDIASAAFFLCTAQARWISGHVLPVDGGGFAISNRGQAGGTDDEEG